MTSLIPPFIQGRVTTPGRPRTGSDKRTLESNERAALYPPAPPHVNYIPADGIMRELVSRALTALSRGIYWDRGSIINLLL